MVGTFVGLNLHGDIPFSKKLAQLNDKKRSFWTRVLGRLILGLSDQQLATGIAILTIGLIRIYRISTYHFCVINNLGMFSCSSHLASVLSLRRYF